MLSGRARFRALRFVVNLSKPAAWGHYPLLRVVLEYHEFGHEFLPFHDLVLEDLVLHLQLLVLVRETVYHHLEVDCVVVERIWVVQAYGLVASRPGKVSNIRRF